MNIINFNCIPPHYRTHTEEFKDQYISVPLFRVIIDGEDIFKKLSYPLESVILSDFIFKNDNMEDYRLNGKYLIGVCSICRCEGCADLFVIVKTKNNITKWIIHSGPPKDAQIIKNFETEKYQREIIKLREYYFSYSWESYDHKLYRVCNEYIRKFKTKNNQNIYGVEFGKNEYNQEMYVYYYDQWEAAEDGDGFVRPYISFTINWNGKTIEDALINLKEFAEKELIENQSDTKFFKHEDIVIYTN